LLFEVNRSKIANGSEIWRPDALFLRFLELVRNNFSKNYSLSEIAIQLQTTVLNLNELAKQHAGKTAQNVIYGLVISEAQRILQYENKRMKEIAFALGFQDPYYFSKFFKNHTGMSPSEYEKSLKS
jgi:AraC family transcriptional regulator, transcriptional activator of pobA